MPNIFTSTKLVQEGSFPSDDIYFGTGVAAFSTTFTSGRLQPPTLDFRFCRFYMPQLSYHFWSGASEETFFDGEGEQHYWISSASTMSWTLRDCALHGGRINLGFPREGTSDWGSAAVGWTNNVFDGVDIRLDPWGLDTAAAALHFSFEARNTFLNHRLSLDPWPTLMGTHGCSKITYSTGSL
jgi:hypothetical protein